jgi:benzoate/toluate 1,2-dioxygenase alpha subunit
MATPDDLEEFRACQFSYLAARALERHVARRHHWIDGPDEAAAAIGMKPLMSGAKTEDEGLFVVQHRHWHEAMRRALDAEAGKKA